MSKQMKPIDLRKLATNFANEKAKEERYWQRNDAKFRAVHQRCSTYDEFRQIVEAAHLRPLDRHETLTLDRQSIAWNQPAANNSSEINISSYESSNNQSIKLSIPKNLQEFVQQWRRIPNDIKIDYLHQLKNLETIFQTDIPTDFLHDLCLLYVFNISYNDAELFVNILINLIQSKRFELIKSFLTDHDKYQLDLLFTRLCSFGNLRYSIFFLRHVYLSIN